MNAITRPQVGEAGRGEARVAARIDPPERFQVQLGVQGDPVIAAAARDPEADGCDLRALHVDARHSRAAFTLDSISGEQIDGALLEAPHELLHAKPAAAQIEEDVHDGLSGSMVGDLSATVRRDDRDVAGIDHVLAPPGESQREYGRMLDEPRLVPGFGSARSRELLHRAPRGLVGHEPERAPDHSTMMTCGCFESSW